MGFGALPQYVIILIRMIGVKMFIDYFKNGLLSYDVIFIFSSSACVIYLFSLLVKIMYSWHWIQLFNGDFVDRGSFSVECIFTLFGFKLLYPNHFFMSRGNFIANFIFNNTSKTKNLTWPFKITVLNQFWVGLFILLLLIFIYFFA